MIFTEDFFSLTSVYPSDDVVQLVDSFTKENVNYKKYTGSAQRPQNNSVGSMIFDTDLLKPIWFNGNNWIDAVGNIV